MVIDIARVQTFFSNSFCFQVLFDNLHNLHNYHNGGSFVLSAAHFGGLSQFSNRVGKKTSQIDLVHCQKNPLSIIFVKLSFAQNRRKGVKIR